MAHEHKKGDIAISINAKKLYMVILAQGDIFTEVYSSQSYFTMPEKSYEVFNTVLMPYTDIFRDSL